VVRTWVFLVLSSSNGQNIDLPAWQNSSSRFEGAANGYLVNHLSKGISDVTIAFPDPENVDFDILYAILFTFWSNFIMLYCVGGGHFGFLAVEIFARGWQSLGTQNSKLHVKSYHIV